MSITGVINTGRTGLAAAKAGINTTGHNIANASSPGYSRQRVEQAAMQPGLPGTGGITGQGVRVTRISRVNDGYLEKQLRNASRDMAHYEEKDMVLKQTEDIFNEMNGDGINRLMSRFFNEFRKLSNDPDNHAVRESVREASQAMVNDFHRIRDEVNGIRSHIDARIEGNVQQINSIARELKELNLKIRAMEASGVKANDLLDARDRALKELATYTEVNAYQDNYGNYCVDIKGVGPLVTAAANEELSVMRTPGDADGKPENAYDIKFSGSAKSVITHQLKGGKLGALLESRDKSLSVVIDRLDEIAYEMVHAVNAIHVQGFARGGGQGNKFFKDLTQKDRAAEFINLSDAVRDNVNNIATAAAPDSPGDNRIALAIAAIQHSKVLGGGHVTMDDFYNSIVSDIGVASARNRSALNQQRDIQTQLGKLREQISGVSLDEETTNLMQFQQAFDASAKVLQIADELIRTVLEIKR